MTKAQKVKQLTQALFGTSEVKNRIGLNAAKMIAGDIVTLYGEFKKASGSGILCFNPYKPDKSSYLKKADIRRDIALAEEMCDDDTAEFLRKTLNVIDKTDERTDAAAVMLLTDAGATLHIVDLNETEERLNKIADASSRD
jgi:hypothetical protein